MKLTGIISAVLLFIYSISTFVGIGVVRCSCTDSQRLVMMSFHPSCMCSDSAEDCCPHNNRHHDEDKESGCHDEDCCSLVYKCVNIDHLIVTKFIDHQTKVFSLLFFPCKLNNVLTDIAKESSSDVKNNSPPGLLKIPIIYLHSQLRL